jgi:hypothetical protein
MNIKRPVRRPAEEPFPDESAEGKKEADDLASLSAGIRGGWSAGQQQMDATADYAQAFKPEPTVQLIKFLEDVPYANYRRHWIDRNTAQGVKKRPYSCPQTVGKNCPICAVGDKAQAVSAFNVALLGDDGVPMLKSWDVGIKLFKVLQGYHSDPKIGPLTKGYFAVSKPTGSNAQTNVIPVKPASLQEDYDIAPPSPAALAAMEVYDADIVQWAKMSELEEVAQELASEYD